MTAMDQPQLFIEHDHGYAIRVLDINGQPWFIGKDIANVLHYRDAANAIRILDEDEKDTHRVSTPGGLQEVAIISESGLYSLILRSNKPEARAFRRWVTHEVLPTIRKHGGYGQPVDLRTIFAFLQEEREARIRFEEAVMDRLILTHGVKDVPVRRLSLSDTRTRILTYVRDAGPAGLSRQVITNRIRDVPERQIALLALLENNTIVEVIRDRKRIYLLPQYVQH